LAVAKPKIRRLSSSASDDLPFNNEVLSQETEMECSNEDEEYETEEELEDGVRTGGVEVDKKDEDNM